MTDPIKAALITGSVQITAAVLTFIVAVSALSSWRRNILGQRQVELAEECLQAIWQIEKDIKAVRLMIAPSELNELQANTKYREFYIARHSTASENIRSCLQKLEELTKKITLAEFYLGSFPMVQDTKVFRYMPEMYYRIDQELSEIVGYLNVLLFIEMSPDWISKAELSDDNIEKFKKNSNMYFGFMYEYEEDYISVRIRKAIKSVERHLRAVLRRRGRIERYFDKIRDAMHDKYHDKFKAVDLNKFAESRSS